MLKKYSVTVCRLVKEQAVFEIEAESGEEARELAAVVILPNNQDEFELHWEPISQSGPSYINSLEEVDI